MIRDKWTDIRSLAEQGVPYETLGEKYELSPATIAVRACRERWLTPRRVKRTLFKQAAAREESSASEYDLVREDATENRNLILSDSWEQKAADLRILSYETAFQAIKRSKELLTIESASDLKAAVSVARQATGLLDTEAPALSLNLFNGPQPGVFPTINLPETPCVKPISELEI